MNSLNYNIKIEGNIAEPRTGSFEVEINGKLVFSRFKTERFPNNNEILGWFN